MGRSNRPSGLPQGLASKVHSRDDYSCIKCGHHSRLEIHHILPVYKGGTDAESNLITLCHSCHRFAPDDPLDFLKYCSAHLPPDFDRATRLTKTFLIVLRHKHPELLNDSTPQGDGAVSAFIDEFAHDIWSAFCSDDMNEFARLMRKYQWEKELEGEN